MAKKRNCWFIPAYAGNSYSRELVQHRAAVHPRLRGELGATRWRYDAPAGSSPLTRGTPFIRLSKWKRERFIPAYAGNSS